MSIYDDPLFKQTVENMINTHVRVSTPPKPLFLPGSGSAAPEPKIYLGSGIEFDAQRERQKAEREKIERAWQQSPYKDDPVYDGNGIFRGWYGPQNGYFVLPGEQMEQNQKWHVRNVIPKSADKPWRVLTGLNWNGTVRPYGDLKCVSIRQFHHRFRKWNKRAGYHCSVRDSDIAWIEEITDWHHGSYNWFVRLLGFGPRPKRRFLGFTF